MPLSVMMDSRVSSGAKLLYGVVNYCQAVRGGVCDETLDDLAMLLGGCSTRTVSNRLSELEDLGFVSVLYTPEGVRQLRICK